MAKLSIKAGATSVSVGLFIQDSSSTTGAGLAGLLFNTASLTCYAVVPGSSAAAITLATLAAANSAWSSGGFKEIDATNMPGWYRFDIPNTNISTGRSVGIHFKGATNMAPLPLEIELTGFDNQSTTDGNLSKLTSLTFTGANKVDASVRDVGGTTVTARDIGASVLLSSGTGTGQLSITSGVVSADMTKLNGSATSASNLQKSASVIWQGSVTGTVSATALIDSTLTQGSTDYWKGRIIIFTSGAAIYQASDITAFNFSTHQLTYSSLSVAPSAADTYVIV